MPYSTLEDLPDHVKRLSNGAQRQWMEVWNSSYAACMRDEFGNASKCEGEAFAKANGVVKGSELDDQYVYHEDQFRLFIEAGKLLTGAAIQDGWFPYLPKPGKYQHPIYGEVSITPEGNEALVESVKSRVYQQHIPIDAEHQTKLSGAVAWLTDMRMNSDGSADAFLEWTARGRLLMSGGQFKYISPEFFGKWPDPATGAVHKNVVAGGAITTRPFFKDKTLRALVASEQGAEVIEGGETPRSPEEFAMQKCPGCGEMMPAGAKTCTECGAKFMSEDTKDKGEVPQTLTMAEVEAKIKEATEASAATFAEQISELKTKAEAAEQLAASEKEAREKIEGQLKEAAARERDRRFSEMVSGKGGSADGAAWAGDPTAQVSILTKMAESFGEDSDEFKQYVEQQTAIATQLATTVFKEYGSSASGGTQSPDSQLDKMAKELAAKSGKPFHQAYAEVMDSDEGRALYERSQAQ